MILLFFQSNITSLVFPTIKLFNPLKMLFILDSLVWSGSRIVLPNYISDPSNYSFATCATIFFEFFFSSKTKIISYATVNESILKLLVLTKLLFFLLQLYDTNR